MNKQIVRVIERFEDAERARQALLDAGFDRNGIDISPTGDEAGPSEANFTVGDSPEVKGGSDYRDVYAPAPDTGRCVVAVTADESQLKRAAEILEYHGGKDNDPAHRH